MLTEFSYIALILLVIQQVGHLIC